MSVKRNVTVPVGNSTLSDRFADTKEPVPGGAEESCNRRATSEADCGRRVGSFARHAAMVSYHPTGTNSGPIFRSFRRSVLAYPLRPWICQSILPVAHA